MKLVFDFHTHTIASGHAYSTVRENIEYAKMKGLKAYGFSDHAEAMQGAFDNMHFFNFRVLPEEIDGVKLFGGMEANIIDFEGSIDATDMYQEKVDYIIASLHPPCIKSGTVAQNTAAIIGAMQNPRIKIIGHPDDSRYPLDLDKVAQAAAETKTVLELNNSSLSPFTGRQNARENMTQLMKACEKYQVRVIVNSDSHICYDVGSFERVIDLIEEVNFPKDLVVNTSLEGLQYVLNT